MIILNTILIARKYVLIFLCVVLAGGYAFVHQSPTMSAGCPIPKIAGNKEFHSQYFEDYILSLVFKTVEKGHYIDVGANSPNQDSVTKYFYSMGWRGINIEPIHKHYLELVKYRPQDVNLNIGIAEQPDTLILSVIFSKNNNDADVLSTFDRAVLKKAVRDGYFFESFPVRVKPMNEVLKAHPLQPIHFIKIDVEGMEGEVLKSIDLSKYRPWVFIVEAVEPRTFIRSDGKWNKTLLQHHYIEVMFDGLNVYYVAEERYQQLHQPVERAYDCALEANKKYHVINNALQTS